MDPATPQSGPPQTPDEDEDGPVQLERPISRRAKWGTEDTGAVFSEEDIAEEERTHRAIPRVRPLTTEELEFTPPAKQHYRLRLRRSLRELIGARELLYTFVERDLKVRYKQTKLGGLWAVLQPLVLMVIFTVVFHKIAKINTGGVPYPVFSYSALVPWGLFSGAVAYGTNAIISNSGIIRKIYCPREVFALSSVASSGFDFLVSSVILLGMLVVYGILGHGTFGHGTWIAFPLLTVVLMIHTTWLTLAVSAVTVFYRDTRYGIPMLLQIALFATPVAYPIGKAINALPPGLQSAYPYLNPLVPVIDGFRRTLAIGRWPEWGPLAASAAIGLIALNVTYVWYKRIDGTFADVI